MSVKSNIFSVLGREFYVGHALSSKLSSKFLVLSQFVNRDSAFCPFSGSVSLAHEPGKRPIKVCENCSV